MNVDVSPDGARVVFDLLGDLYVMPIGGSTAAAPATRLTTGPAFDMQPRFSPDGKRIAFTSDRGGLFNIWVMDADGQKPTAVSREEKWWVNSPTWAPDGDFIFARKHFVSTRSLGAGEVWMYHRSGADGVQVTEKVSFQKDAGEPALSADGKFLYYSKDVTPSPTFEYDKNPHAGIYAIIRRELATGRERTIVGGAGGAITPRVSPDGKWLAFIRRIDTGSQLFVRSLATGAERPIFAHLDKDQQEAWTIFGPYAQYAWLPDAKGLVVWGEGKIWRVDLPAGAPAPGAPLQAGREIPFVAKVEQTITEAVRFPVTVAPDRFPVRMLRGAVVAPDGKSVVYSALGKLWIRALPTGTPKRLTARDDLEYAPAFSPDGRTIVYASWRDAERGRIRTIGVNGSGGREVVGDAWSLRRAVVLARRPAHRLSRRRGRRRARAGRRRAARHLHRACRRRWAHPRAGGGIEPALRRDRHAPLLPGAPRRSDGARQRDHRKRLRDRPRALRKRRRAGAVT